MDTISSLAHGNQDVVDEIVSYLCIDDRRIIGYGPRRMRAMQPLVIPSLLQKVRVVDVMNSSTSIVHEIELPSFHRYQIVVHRPLSYSWIERETRPPFDVSVRLYGGKVHEEYSKTEWDYLPHSWSFTRWR
jgi:hypothetical protein